MRVIFKETFYENNQPHNELIYVRQAGQLHGDADYAIERADSPTNVIGCVLSGVLYIDMVQKRHRLGQGDGFLLAHGRAYRIFSDMREPPEMLWLNVRGRLFDSMADSMFPNGIAISGFNCEPTIRGVISDIAARAEAMPAVAKKLFALLIDLRGCVRAENEPGGESESLAKRYDEYICQNIQYPFSVGRMADTFGISTDTLNRTFREALGDTPYSYYQRIRLDFARSLLMNTALSIDDIASRLNYVDRNYFTLCFTKHMGKPPALYRRQNSADKLRG